MVVGVLQETKDYEYRVALVPAGVAALRARGLNLRDGQIVYPALHALA